MLKVDGALTTGLVYVNLFAAAGGAIFMLSRINDGLDWVSSLFACIGLGISAWSIYSFFRRLNTFKVDILDGGAFVMPPDSIIEFVDETLAVAEFLGIDRGRLVILIAKRAKGTSPSTLFQGEKDYLILPLGFLRLIELHPRVARSMLLHELGHVEQKDVRLWSLGTAFHDSLMKFMMPANFGFAVLYLLIIPIGVSNVERASSLIDQQVNSQKTTLAAEYADREAQVPADEVMQLESAKFSDEMKIDSQVWSAKRKLPDPYGGPILAATYSLLSSLFIMGMQGSMKKVRFTWERLADQAAVGAGYGNELAFAVSQYASGKSRYHPTLQERLLDIQYAISLDHQPVK
jgi:hypothetical protein